MHDLIYDVLFGNLSDLYIELKIIKWNNFDSSYFVIFDSLCNFYKMNTEQTTAKFS